MVGLNQFAEVETWAALGTNQQLAYATHEIFRYFGKFPPPIATYLISQFTHENDLVIDPMCGSGTTALEAGILKRKLPFRICVPIWKQLIKMHCK